MRKVILLLGLFIVVSSSYSQTYNYKFRLKLKDKGQTSYTTDKPEEFLSAKAIERRKNQNISIDSTDLPVSDTYIKQIESLGGIVVAKSKWLATVSVHCQDSLLVEDMKKLQFVSDVTLVWKGRPRQGLIFGSDSIVKYPVVKADTLENYYGEGLLNISMNNGRYLHEAGYKGKGMDIAVIDAGFNKLPYIEMLNNLDIKGAKRFVYGDENPYKKVNQHGLNVLSCIATNKPHLFVGTAPEASFWLFGTEDSRSEFPIEEDYWTAAIEYADSVGVDVVNSSLGYNDFDSPAKSYTHADLDGRTPFITQAANKASQKGMLLVVSAGNSGMTEWKKITPPSDSPYVLAVGAVKRDSVIAPFSSRGMTADLRVKPDVMAFGMGSTVVNDKGLISHNSGTSFSSPILCGMVACLWQAYPSLTNQEVIQVVRESSDRYNVFNEDYGYGIPDMKKAMELAQAIAEQKAKR